MLIRAVKDAVARKVRHVVMAPIRQDVGELRTQMRSLARQLERVEGTVNGIAETASRAARIAAQVRLTMQLNDNQEEALAELDAMLADDRVLEHVRQAIAASPLDLEPYPHCVVENLLPPAFYRLRRAAIPPRPFFADRDPVKQNLSMPMDFGPRLSVRMFHLLDGAVARQAIRPAVIEKCHQPLQHLYEELFGVEFMARAEGLPQAPSGGRLMLRKAGYHLKPHRDPKRAWLTCLLYLAGQGEDESLGTQIFRVSDDHEATFTHTYYPEEHGSRCELVKVVPYRANTMLVFLNSTGAHGAVIPPDAPAHLERFSYQFYIGPGADSLNDLIKDLPPDRQKRWRSPKAQMYAE
jgi:hypothetical protein